MSLITQYRPQKWSEVIGQDPVVKALKESVEQNDCQTYMFTGPSGVGKTTLARILGKALGCELKDIREIDAATYTGIDDMRALTESLKYRPLGKAQVKMIIIDEVHALSRPAITSLLKALEEPPPWVYFSLCTTEPDRIIGTIQTRCKILHLKSVKETLLFDLLAGVREAEDIDVSDSILELCCKEAEGSPRAALSNMGLCFAARDRKEAAELLLSAYDSTDGLDLARALSKDLSWEQLRDIIKRIEPEKVEIVRRNILGYMTSVALSATSDQMPYVMSVLDAFDQPFPLHQKLESLVYAAGKVKFRS